MALAPTDVLDIGLLGLVLPLSDSSKVFYANLLLHRALESYTDSNDLVNENPIHLCKVSISGFEESS